LLLINLQTVYLEISALLRKKRQNSLDLFEQLGIGDCLLWTLTFPKVRLLAGEVERDRWLTPAEADRLISVCPPHLAAIVRFALATGCRASEITGLEWKRVDLDRKTAWLNRTKNGTPRGVPLNADTVAVLDGETGKHPSYCFTYRGEPIRWGVCNTGWLEAVKKAALSDFRFHDLRHT